MFVSATALGAIAAATLTALVTLIGLILTKEQKVSEFRQEWINSLRAELSTYLTNVNLARDLNNVDYANYEAKVKAQSDTYSKMNMSSFSINLRINPDEKLSQDVLGPMIEFQTMLATGGKIHPDAIRPVEQRFLKAAKALLKSEWKRVKKGELTFRIARAASISIVVIGLIIGTAYFTGRTIPFLEIQTEPSSPAVPSAKQ